MKNPYLILDVGQNATTDEIEIARKRQLKLQCADDVNKKNNEGEYLQDVINQAANDLLDLEKRKEIDEKIKQENIKSPALYDSSQQHLSLIALTKMNVELIEALPKLSIKRNLFEKKVKCKRFFAVVLCNGSVVYAIEEKVSMDDSGCSSWALYEYFTDRQLTENFQSGICPWDKFDIFDVDGILAIAYPAYQIFPNSIIWNGKVSDNVLRKIFPILQSTADNNKEEIMKVFQK